MDVDGGGVVGRSGGGAFGLPSPPLSHYAVVTIKVVRIWSYPARAAAAVMSDIALLWVDCAVGIGSDVAYFFGMEAPFAAVVGLSRATFTVMGNGVVLAKDMGAVLLRLAVRTRTGLVRIATFSIGAGAMVTWVVVRPSLSVACSAIIHPIRTTRSITASMAAAGTTTLSTGWAAALGVIKLTRKAAFATLGLDHASMVARGFNVTHARPAKFLKWLAKGTSALYGLLWESMKDSGTGVRY